MNCGLAFGTAFRTAIVREESRQEFSHIYGQQWVIPIWSRKPRSWNPQICCGILFTAKFRVLWWLLVGLFFASPLSCMLIIAQPVSRNLGQASIGTYIGITLTWLTSGPGSQPYPHTRFLYLQYSCEKCSGNLWSEQQRLSLVARLVTWLILVFGLCCYTIHYLKSSVKGMISSGEHLQLRNVFIAVLLEISIEKKVFNSSNQCVIIVKVFFPNSKGI